MKSFVARDRGKGLGREIIWVLAGFENSIGQPVHGIFEVCILPEILRRQMEKASKNKSKQSWDGPVVVFYQKATEAQAQFLIKGLQRAGTSGQRKTEET